jgi:hypothetical protein
MTHSLAFCRHRLVIASSSSPPTTPSPTPQSHDCCTNPLHHDSLARVTQQLQLELVSITTTTTEVVALMDTAAAACTEAAAASMTTTATDVV